MKSTHLYPAERLESNEMKLRDVTGKLEFVA